MHRIAESNLAIYRTRDALRAPVQFVSANALDVEFADESQVVYLYNPFDESVLKRFKHGLLKHVRSADLVIAYVNPIHKEVLAADGALEVLFADQTLVVYRRKRA